MAELILVKAADPERVALWERAAEHPGEEAWVAGEDAVLVALTALVQKRLDQGVLVRVDDAPTPSEAAPVDDAPTVDDAPVAPKSKKAKA